METNVLHGYSFAPCLTVLCYKGDKERRADLQREADTQDFHVLLTTYEVSGCCVGTKGPFICVKTDINSFILQLCLKDASYLKR